ncbi:hypothetical protein Plhal710r2_c019g0082861 [Plasmopara halstedii]
MRRRVKFVLVLTAIALATNVIASVTPVPSPQPSERDATDFEAKKSVKPENMNDGAVQDFNVEERTALHGIEDVEMLGHSTESFGNKMLHVLKRIIGYQPPASASKSLLEIKSAKDARSFKKMSSTDAQTQPSVWMTRIKWLVKKLIYLLKRFIGYQPPVKKNPLEAKSTESVPLLEKAPISSTNVQSHAKTKLDSVELKPTHSSNEKVTTSETQSHAETNLDSNEPKRTHSLKEKVATSDVENLIPLVLDKNALVLYKIVITEKTPSDMLSTLRSYAIAHFYWRPGSFTYIQAYIKACEHTAPNRSGDKWGVEAAYSYAQSRNMLARFAKKLSKMENEGNEQEKAVAQRIRLGLKDVKHTNEDSKREFERLFGSNIQPNTVV